MKQNSRRISFTKIYIKNMCCLRCIVEVNQILNSLKLKIADIKLGEVMLVKKMPESKSDALQKLLKEKGFELVVHKNDQYAVVIQRFLIQYLDHQVLGLNNTENISVYLTKNMNMNYNKISNLFKTSVGITIEKYFIKLKIEKAKDLLMPGDIEIADVAWLLGYSSAQNFSTIFKKETGKTPGEYKKNPLPHRIFRDSLTGVKSNKNDDKQNLNK